MKSDTLNCVLTFVLGALVLLGVVFALKVVFITRDSRSLQRLMSHDAAIIEQTQTLYNDTVAYNQKYPSTELTHILQSMQAKPGATH